MRSIQKRLAYFLSMMGLATICTAAPFEKTIRYVQPDGAAIELWGKGDEFHAVFETLDGYTVVFSPTEKAYFYAALSADGTDLVPTGLQVGQGDPAARGLAKHVRMSADVAKVKAKVRIQQWDNATKNSERWRERKAALRAAESAAADGRTILSPPTFTTTGTKVGLCLLIDFSDDTNTISRAEIINFCNADAYTGYGNNGSVKKYFQDNSNGLLTYTNIVTVYIRMVQPKTYYNDTSKDCGEQGNLLIKDAVAIMKALPNYAAEIAPAFANLTVYGDGYIQACNVFYAGDNGGVWTYGLWPHSWALYNAGEQELTTGVKIFPYQITNIGSSLELGTFCHENGHMLCGFPDIYDYGYDSVGGAGMFCLMDYGGGGGNPVQICAYLKRASGWATTVDLTSASTLTASLSASGVGFNTFYRYVKPGVSTEYYLVENRQQSGRDTYIPASGIAIWHIDELGDKDNQNLAYNTAHANYEVTLVQADNLWHFQNNINAGDSLDLFYNGNAAFGYANQFNDLTAPCARWWDGSLSGVNFGSFSVNGPTMTFGVVSIGLFISTPNTLPKGNLLTAYTQTFTAAGGVEPYTWAVVSNVPPEGLVLSGSGVLSGTPTVAGTAVFGVRVTDAASHSYATTLSLTISPPHLVPFTENFENGGAMPDGWRQEYATGESDWMFISGSYWDGATPASAHGGNYNAYFSPTWNEDGTTKLVSPLLDLGDNPEAPQLSFWHGMSQWYGSVAELRVYYKSTPSDVWTLLATYTDEVTAWTNRTLILPNPSRTYSIAFEGRMNSSLGVSIDDVRVTAGIQPVHNLPFEETFENNGNMPVDWTQEYVTDTTDWAFQNGGVFGNPAGAHNGNYNACLFFNGWITKETMLVSPMLDLGENPEAPQLTFWHCMKNWEGDQDELFVYYKTSEDGEWFLLAEYYDDVPEWSPRVIDLPEWSRTFFIAFVGVTKYGYGVCIDDVKVTAAPAEPLVNTTSHLSGVRDTPYSQTLTAIGGTTPYEWSVVSGTLPPWLTLSNDGVLSGTPTTPTNIAFNVRVVGNNGLASTNLFELSIVPPLSLPFVETFESRGNRPEGWWQQSVTGTLDWLFMFGSPYGYTNDWGWAFNGNYNACFFNAGYGSVTRLISPKLDLGAAPQNVQLSFWHCMAEWVWEGGVDQDELRVYYKTTVEGEWTLLAQYTEDTPAWTRRTLTLPASSRYCFIAFEGTANFGYGVCVDDVVVAKDSPYTQWLTSWFSLDEIAAGGVAGQNDDPDWDGIVNLLEYAWGLVPWSADDIGFPVGGVWNQYLMLNYRQNKQATDLVYEVEACANLPENVWTTNSVSEVSRADSNEWWQVTTRHNVQVPNAPSRFLRLKVTLP